VQCRAKDARMKIKIMKDRYYYQLDLLEALQWLYSCLKEAKIGTVKAKYGILK
jgi:hypothetical protein